MFAMPYSRYIVGTLPWYSVLILTGIITALLLCQREEKRLGLLQDTTLDLALRIVPCGVIGARLYYVIFNWSAFADDPLSILRIWEGGLAIYGGIIGGLAAGIWFSRKRRIPLLTLTDLVLPGVALGQAIGRWGNYFNMEAFGRAVTNPKWQFFPVSVLIPEDGQQVWHMATFFYESAWDLMVFLALWFGVRKHAKRRGTVTLWYMLLYGLGRFFIEGLRTDSLMAGNVRVSQLLSGCICLFAAVALVVRRFRPAPDTSTSSTNHT